MEKRVADTAAHERDFNAEMFRHVPAQHCRRYVTVQERRQDTAAGRRVPDKFAILREPTARH